MAEPQDLLIQEINDEIKAERLLKWWQRFGSFVVALCALLVLATGGYVYWKNLRQEANQTVTATLLDTNEALDRKQYDTAAGQLTGVDNKAGSVALLARLKAASAYEQAGEAEKAKAEYAAVAGAAKQEPALAAYARLRRNNYDAGAEAPFAPLTAELKAIQLFETGKKKEAQEALQALLNDPALPRTARGRVEELLAAFR